MKYELMCNLFVTYYVVYVAGSAWDKTSSWKTAGNW